MSDVSLSLITNLSAFEHSTFYITAHNTHSNRDGRISSSGIRIRSVFH